MKKEKEQGQWTVTICLRDGTVINPDEYVVPADHKIYKVLEMIENNRRKTA